MKRNALKTTSLVIVSAMALSMTSCSQITDLLGKDTTEEDIEEMITSYMDNVVSGKYSKAAKYVVDGENGALMTNELDDDHVAIMEALIATTEYEITDINATKEKSGKATVTITVADIESVLEEADSLEPDSIIDALADADKVEQELTLKLTYDDEWLIKDASPVEGYYVDAVEDIEFMALNEDVAMEYLTALLDDMCDGDIVAAFNATRTSESQYTDLDEYLADHENAEGFLSVIFSNTSYSASVGTVAPEYIDIDVSFISPNPSDAFAPAYTDEVITALYAYSIFAPDDEAGRESVEDQLRDNFYSEISNVTPSVVSDCTYRITLDENGEITHELLNSLALFDIDLSFDASTVFADRDSTEFIMPAADYALDNGLITQDEYDAFVSEMTNGQGDDEINVEIDDSVPTEASIEVSESSSDYFGLGFYTEDDFYYDTYTYTTSFDGIYMRVWTWAYYDAGTTMSCDVYFNNEFVETITYVNQTDSYDKGFLAFEPADGLQVGVYTLVITGYNGEEFAVATVSIAE